MLSSSTKTKKLDKFFICDIVINEDKKTLYMEVKMEKAGVERRDMELEIELENERARREWERELAIMKTGYGCSLLTLIALSTLCLPYYTKITERLEVIDKYVKTEGENDVFYVVGKKSNGKIEVFSNSDSFHFFKFNSADVQQQIDIGKEYECGVYWMRIPLLSMYRNIINAKPVSDNTDKEAVESSKVLETNYSPLEARYAKSLLKIITETPNANIAELIQAHTLLESAKDKENASKIQAIGNKYYETYKNTSSVEDFKQMLKERDVKDSGGKTIKRNQPLSVTFTKNDYQRA